MQKHLSIFMRNCLLIIILTLLILMGSAAYAQAAETDALANALVLVNPDHPLPAYLEPEGLTYLSGFMNAGGNVRLRPDAAAALKEMIAGLKAAGITDIYANSGYRNYVLQGDLYSAKVASYRRQGLDEEAARAAAGRWVLPPGTSEHQSGLAVDLSTSATGYDLVENFANTAAGRWLAENCVKYGFIIRYKAEKESLTGVASEPWHFRYIGADHAFYMRQHDLCLEEYHALLKEQGLLLFTNAAGEMRAVYYSKEDNSAALPGEVLSVSLASRGNSEYIITTNPPKAPLFDAKGHWGESFIQRLYGLKLVAGYPDNSFRPNNPVSRGEFITILSRLSLPAFLEEEPDSGEEEEELEEAAKAEEAEPPKATKGEEAAPAKTAQGDKAAQPEPAKGAETAQPEPAKGAETAPDKAAQGAETAQTEAVDEDETDAQGEETEAGEAAPENLLPYADINPKAYYYQPLLLCYKASLVQVLENKNIQPLLFEPARPISRGEAALLLAQLFGAEDFLLPPAISYQDVPPATGQLYRAVELLTAYEIFAGDGDGNFYPQRSVSRAEMSKMLCRLLDALEEIEAKKLAAAEAEEEEEKKTDKTKGKEYIADNDD